MRACRIFTPFWELVRGFGIKFEPKDENIISLKGRLLSDFGTNIELFSLRYCDACADRLLI